MSLMWLRDLLRQIARCNSGTATIEMAIILPLAILLMTGGVEFSNLFGDYGTANKSVRDATRYLARVPYQDASGNLNGALCAGGWGLKNATNLAVYGNISGTGTPILPTGTTVTLINGDCNNPTDITLEADVPYNPLVFASIPFTSISFTGWIIKVSHQEAWIGE
jgi:Flp pilus assembly protein TadG